MTSTAEFVMPKLGLTMAEGRIARWMVAPGAHFAAGDVIVEIETDKIVNEVEAPSAGTLLELLEPEGATMPVGAPIARWQPVGGGAAPAGEPAGKPAPGASSVEPPAAAAEAPSHALRRNRQGGARILSTPYARKLARQAGLDIAVIEGTGPNGRIKAGDVERARSTPQVPAVRAVALTPSLAPAAPARAKDLSFVTATIDAGRLREVEDSLSRMQPGVHRLHVVALACIRALAAMGGTADTLPIGLAPATPAWSQVPTLQAHPRTTLSALMAQVADLEARAAKGDLLPEEIEGGRLVILAGNDTVGVFGPAAPAGWDAALGVGAVRAVFRPGTDGSPVLGRELTLALSYAASEWSHASALDLLARIKGLLDEPLSMLV